jgi:tRNA(fMet)-specific endonuclease VapC
VNERFLLDTNALSEPMQRTPNLKFLARFRAHAGEMATAAPAFHEMLFGCLRLPPSHRRTEIQAFIQAVVIATIPILPYDQTAAEWHAIERVRLTAIGRTPPLADGQIAAVAATRGLILVTANVSDFQHFAGLTVVHWRL